VRARAMQSENGAQVEGSDEKGRATESERGDKKAENSNLNIAGFKESSN